MQHTGISYKHKTCRTITRSRGPNQRILVFSLRDGCNNLYFTRKIRVYKEISSKEKFLTPRTARNGRKYQEKAAKQIHDIYIYIVIFTKSISSSSRKYLQSVLIQQGINQIQIKQEQIPMEVARAVVLQNTISGQKQNQSELIATHERV